MATSAWSTQQLAEFVAAVSGADSETSAAIAAVERAAEALDADVAAIVGDGELHAAIGYPAGTAPVHELEAVKPGLASSSLEVPGVGTCKAAAAALEHPPGATLVVARPAPDGLTPEESGLLRAMARVASITMRSLRVLDSERLAREEFERVFTLSLDLLCIAGFDGYLKRANPAWQRTFGYTEHELLSRPFLDFVHPDDRGRTEAVVAELARGHDLMEFENRHLCRDGSVRWMQWTARPVPEQGVAYAVGRDVTDRRRSEVEQAALRRVATLVARAVAQAEVFDAVTREVGLLCEADLARMERFEPDDTVTAIAAWSRSRETELAVGTRFDLQGTSIAAQVIATGRPARVDSFEGATGPIAREAQALGVRSSVGCPIVVGGRTWGVIAASTMAEAPFPPNTESRIADFTELVATAISNAEAQADLVASRARLLQAGDETRRRLERDLHDGAQQLLIHTIITLKFARRARANGDHEAAGRLVEEALQHAEQANHELRELAHGILPGVLARGGLAAGVEALVSRAPLRVTADVTEQRFSPEIEASAYFVVAEALTNVAKHAQAQTAHVAASVDDGDLHVTVSDDGVGGARPDGSGLVGLQDRIAALGGRLRIESPPGRGTRVTARLPVQRPGGDSQRPGVSQSTSRPRPSRSAMWNASRSCSDV
jgi:PAS domain S-box-containing protein